MNCFHPHSIPYHILDYHPHPIPIPDDSCIEVRDLQVRIMQHAFVCKQKLHITLAVTVLYKTLFCKIKSSNDSSVKHKQPGEQ